MVRQGLPAGCGGAYRGGGLGPSASNDVYMIRRPYMAISIMDTLDCCFALSLLSLWILWIVVLI